MLRNKSTGLQNLHHLQQTAWIKHVPGGIGVFRPYPATGISSPRRRPAARQSAKSRAVHGWCPPLRCVRIGASNRFLDLVRAGRQPPRLHREVAAVWHSRKRRVEQRHRRGRWVDKAPSVLHGKGRGSLEELAWATAAHRSLQQPQIPAPGHCIFVAPACTCGVCTHAVVCAYARPHPPPTLLLLLSIRPSNCRKAGLLRQLIHTRAWSVRKDHPSCARFKDSHAQATNYVHRRRGTSVSDMSPPGVAPRWRSVRLF